MGSEELSKLTKLDAQVTSVTLSLEWLDKELTRLKADYLKADKEERAKITSQVDTLYGRLHLDKKKLEELTDQYKQLNRSQ